MPKTFHCLPRITISVHLLPLLLLAVLILFPVGRFALRDLDSPNLWFDESGQYWLARFQHHYMAPGSPDGGLSQFVEHSRLFNSDPGGFTLLLKAWIGLFGSSPTALRSLPFVFFLVAMVILYMGSRSLGAPPTWSIFGPALLVANSMMLHYATEIRAYSMEVCAVAWLFFTPIMLGKLRSARSQLAAGVFSALLSSARYSAFLPAAAACLCAIHPLKPWRAAGVRLLCFAAPIVFMVVAAYFVFVRYQAYQAGASNEPPAYVQHLMFAGKSWPEAVGLLTTNFWSLQGLLIAALMMSGLASWLLRGKCTFVPRLRKLALFTAITLLLTAILSAFGKLPWAVNTRWSIGYHALAICCGSALLATIGAALQSTKQRFPAWLNLVLLLCAGVSIGFSQLKAYSFGRPSYENLHTLLKKINTDSSPRFYVAREAISTSRYLLEVSPLKNKLGYPKSFHFETSSEQKEKSPISGQEFDIVVLNTSTIVADYRERIIGKTHEVHGEAGLSAMLFIQP
jgi:hypothetical protein